jgi:hypothetical protein
VRGKEALTLGQFRAGVEACLLHEDFCEACELLHADVMHEAALAAMPTRTLALAVLEQLSRHEPSAKWGSARGIATTPTPLFAPEALKAALQRAASPAGQDDEGMAAARTALDHAKRATAGATRSVAGAKDDVTYAEFARAVSVVLRMLPIELQR